MFKKLKEIFIINNPQEKIKVITLIFLLSLWFLNPNNKLILVFFLGFLFYLNYLTKDFLLSLILTFFLSSFFPIGKTYLIQLYDLKKFPNLKPFYPLGLVAEIKLSVNDIIFALLIIYLLIFYKRNIKLKIALSDFLLIIFFLYGVFSDILVSDNIFLSLFSKKELLKFIFIYFLIKFFIKDHTLLFKSLFFVIISLVLFEIFIAFQQIVYSSPINKNLEITHIIIPFGQAPDESYFIFRPPGTFDHANYFALFLTSVFPLFFLLVIKKNFFIYKFIFFLIIVCLVLTLSRGAWLVFLINLLIILFYFEYYKKKNLSKIFSFKEIIFSGLLLIILLFYSFPRIEGMFNILQEGGGLNVRIKQLKETLTLIFKNPFFGFGTGMSVVSAIKNNPRGVFASFPSEIHNYYFLIAVENGLPYLFLFILFLFFSLKELLNYKNDLAFISFISILSILSIGLFQPFIENSLIFTLLAFDYDKINKSFYG